MSSLLTVSVDSGLCNDFILPLSWISNSSHFERCSDLWKTDHLITMGNNSQMFPMEIVYVSVRDLLFNYFLPYLTCLGHLIDSYDLLLKQTKCMIL